MAELSRRQFTQVSLTTLITTSLLQMFLEQDALAQKVKPITEKWLKDLVAMSLDLEKTDGAGAKVTQLQWQKKVEELYGKVELDEMLKLVDFQKLMEQGGGRQRGGERSLRVDFPKIEGLPTHMGFGRQIFEVQKGSSVVPHGHNNMATAFYILKGEFHGRHFDRVGDETGHMIVKPTIDKTFGPTGTSTISDFKDNVHWFKATSEVGYIFNIHVNNCNPGSGKETGRIYIDPNGEKLSGGLIRAKVINAAEAYKLYG